MTTKQIRFGAPKNRIRPPRQADPKAVERRKKLEEIMERKRLEEDTADVFGDGNERSF